MLILTLGTCGIYYLFLLYRWIKAINEESGKEYVNPSFAVLLTICTLGIAGIYFEYQLIKHGQLIIQRTNSSQNPKRNDIPMPPRNIKEIVLWGNIFAEAIGFASGGAAIIISIAAALYLMILKQRFVEYALCINSPENTF